MESSTVVAFRALVLVACLIVVPLAAIFGSQFPDVVKSVLINRIFPNGVPGMAHEEPSRDTAPAFAAVSEAAPWPSGQAATSGPSAIAAAAAAGGRRGAGLVCLGRRNGRGLESIRRAGPSRMGRGADGWTAGRGGTGGSGVAGRPAARRPAESDSGRQPAGGDRTGRHGWRERASGWTARSIHGDGASAARAGSDVLFAGDVGERLSLPLQNGDCQRSDPHSTIRGDRHRSATSDGARGRAGGSLASGSASLIVCSQRVVGRTG